MTPPAPSVAEGVDATPGVSPEENGSDGRAVADASAGEPLRAPARPRARRQPREASAPRSSERGAAGTVIDFAALWEPPADEPLVAVATRIPASLSQAFDRHAQQLRASEPRGATQRSLPKQDLFAALVWAIGDPADKHSAELVGELYRHYRARRLSAQAEQARQE